MAWCADAVSGRAVQGAYMPAMPPKGSLMPETDLILRHKRLKQVNAAHAL
ncbi:MAG: hypothetical protein ACJA1E_000424 [Paracoccaceae bacterium]|jgi:hypothetical protein